MYTWCGSTHNWRRACRWAAKPIPYQAAHGVDLAFHATDIGDNLAAFLLRILPLAEKLWLYSGWLYIFFHLRDYWYWRGVAAEVGTPDKIARLFADSKKQNPAPPLWRIDLADGLEAAETLLTQHRPAAIRLHMGQERLADIPTTFGMERWHGGHLRRLLATHLPGQTAIALAMYQTIPDH